jgi:hypothetical protein
MPGTAFTKGIQVGKLMAKDYRGVLLIMLAMVMSTKGKEILKRSRNFKDKEETTLNNWILLLELMLEWESYLNEPLMYVRETCETAGEKTPVHHVYYQESGPTNS